MEVLKPVPEEKTKKEAKLKKVMIIVSKATLENVYASFILANGARMEGIESELFFCTIYAIL